MKRAAPLVLLCIPAGALLFAWALWSLVARDGLSMLDIVFVLAATWGVPAALLGLLWVPLLPAYGGLRSRIPCLEHLPDQVPTCAIVYAVYKEPLDDVMQRVAASWRDLSVKAPGLAAKTRYFILSDSPTGYEAHERKEVAVATVSAGVPVTYRRRLQNTFAKQGNVCDFLSSAAAESYDFMICLDADSFITGEAIGRLVRVLLHPDNEDVGLVQQLTFVHRAASLISAVDAWSRRHTGVAPALVITRLLGGGNFFGHNFIARPRPLRLAMERVLASPVRSICPGLRGYLMSHDYSEGAVLSELGYRVLVDDCVTGSYEETPNTLNEFIRRERRWCRGVLQWAAGGWALRGKLPQRIVLMQAIHSYLNCPIGVVGFLTGLAIFCRGDAFLGATAAGWHAETASARWSCTNLPYILLAATVMAISLAPLAALAWNVRRRNPEAGPVRFLAAFLTDLPELVVASLYGLFVGPIVSVATALACLSVAISKSAWIPPARGRVAYSIKEAVVDLLPIWLLGMVVLLVAAAEPGDVRVFLLIIGVPLAFAPVTALVVSSRSAFRAFRTIGLFHDIDGDKATAVPGA